MTLTLDIDPSSVFLASGGARGITAQCAIRLAQEYQGKWILLGRSAIASEESDWANDCFDEAELKRRIMQDLLDQGVKPTPRDIQKVYKTLSSRREVLHTLNTIRQAGGQAEYLNADVTNFDSLQAQVAAITQRLGPISGILHGAGNLADKLIERKTEQDFETVYAAKVQGLENLLRCIPAEQLNYLVLFSSVAGFYGNAGQADYAIANEILNKSAHRLKRQHPACHVVAIDWGPWDSGMVTPELKKAYAEHNVEVIPVADGTQLLAEELHSRNRDIAQVVIGSPLPVPIRPVSPELRTHSIRRRLTLADNPFLSDHEIAEYPVLPATCAMAWIINACEQVYPGYKFFRCENFKIFKGIVFDQNLVGEYILDLKEVLKTDSKSIEIEAKVWSKTNTGKIHYHYTSQLNLLQNVPTAPAYEALNLRPDLSIPTPASSFYEVGDSALFHGLSFQGIKNIVNISPESITVQAFWQSLSEQRQGQFQIQTVNPYIVDLSMHPLWIWTQHYHQKACLPAEVQKFEQFAITPADEPFYISTELKSLTKTSVTANFIIHNEQGLIQSRMIGAKATLLDMNLLRKNNLRTH
jgi:NAD(P)-dependent dehydrogenase (short-subunit alcohol dehydrogenase family)